jgi:uncharacterized membrane protein
MNDLWAVLASMWRWMGVNLALAALPVVLAVCLQLLTRTARSGAARLAAAGPVLLTAVLLPNTPYVLTDLRHGPASVSAVAELPDLFLMSLGLLAVLASYTLLVTVGAVGYVLVLQLLRVRLRQVRSSALLLGLAELLVHVGCSVGIWLGHTYTRANTWDLWERPLWLAEHGGAAVLEPPARVLVPLGTVGLALLVLVGRRCWWILCTRCRSGPSRTGGLRKAPGAEVLPDLPFVERLPEADRVHDLLASFQQFLR